MSNNFVRIDNQNHGPNSRHVFVGLIVSLVTLLTCFELISSLGITAFVSIFFFNFLFVFLLFPLEGTISRKVMLLIAGNFVGIVWHLFLASFESVFLYFSTANLKIVFLVFLPLANFMWIVSLWSISLSILAKNNPRKNRFWEQH